MSTHSSTGHAYMCMRDGAYDILRRIATTTVQAFSAERRCYVIGEGLRSISDSDVLCSVPGCGERMSSALPRFICDKVRNGLLFCLLPPWRRDLLAFKKCTGRPPSLLFFMRFCSSRALLSSLFSQDF